MPASLRRRSMMPATPGRWINLHHSGPHGARQYDVYIPAGLSSHTKAPVFLLLHGCRQTPVEFARASGSTLAADDHGFLLVAPRQEMRHQLQSCWRWYESAHQHRDSGEPAILKDIVDEVLAAKSDWRADPHRVYVAGISAGGAMALILATTYPDVFAAAGVHSATAYGSATQSFGALSAMAARGAGPTHAAGQMAPVVVIHGTADQVVRPPNGDRIIDQWLTSRDDGRSRGLSRVRPLATTRVLLVGGRRCTRTRWYSARGRRVLEYWRVDGLGHAWSGGRSSGAFIDTKGPKATEVMWTFFSRHRLSSVAELPAGAPALPGSVEDFEVGHHLDWPAPTL